MKIAEHEAVVRELHEAMAFLLSMIGEVPSSVWSLAARERLDEAKRVYAKYVEVR